MNSTKTYALIDNCSGYVWGVYAAASPEAACAAATLNDGGEIATYEFAYQLASNESGYLVYDAPGGFIAIDGQNPDEIAAVSPMKLIGKFRRMQSDSVDSEANMTQAQNYVILFEGGNKNQARELAENMSVSELQDWENESTVFIFEDGSAVFTSGPEFRVANADEMS